MCAGTPAAATLSWAPLSAPKSGSASGTGTMIVDSFAIKVSADYRSIHNSKFERTREKHHFYYEN
jgi:hypothetical protein